MLNPFKTSELAKPLSDLYAELENELIESIAKRFAKNLDLTDTTKWELKKLAEIGALQKDTIKIIAQKVGVAPDLLYVALENGAFESIKDLEPVFKKLAIDGYIRNTKTTPSKSIKKAINTYQNQALDRLNMVNTVMQYKAKNTYIHLIKNTAKFYKDDRQSTLDILNKFTGSAIVGIDSRQTAVRKAVKEMINKGIPAFVDKRGREWSPEAYINMDIRTTVSNTAHKAQFNRMEDYGINLIMVSSHSGARPKCAKDQGKIFDKNNKSGYTTDLHGKKIKYYSFKSSSYGEPDGLLGINCGHQIYPFVPGLNIQRYLPTQDFNENDRLYKESQEQRALERDIRKYKRECSVYDAVSDKEMFEKSAVKLKAKEKELNEFTLKNNRTRKRDREQVEGFDRSVSSKAVSANKRIVNKANSLYNLSNEKENLNLYFKDEKLKNKIKSQDTIKTVHMGKQGKHIKGHNNYIDGRSYLTISEQEVQELVNKYAGSGELLRSDSGKWANKELINADNIIGVNVNNVTMEETETSSFIIHYSSKGVHIVPTLKGVR